MLICGLQRLSLLDYPEKLAATVFTGGCNLRCPFCHNAALVTKVSDTPSFSENEVLHFLESRIGKLDGVCITGGEPLLQSDIDDFIVKIRKLGFLVKLDTNGVFPEKLSRLLSKGLLDYVAMDIKNSPEKYAATAGIPDFDPAPVFESARLIMDSGIPYEFRTTLVREFHTETDIEKIGVSVLGAKNYFLQNFEDSGDLVGFENSGSPCFLSGFSAAEMEHFKKILSKYVLRAEIRN